jgi:hypothetical protein
LHKGNPGVPFLTWRGDASPDAVLGHLRAYRNPWRCGVSVGRGLAVLHLVLSWGEVPQPLLRDRPAQHAAKASATLTARPERAADQRDEVHLLHPGDLSGPARNLVALRYHVYGIGHRGNSSPARKG